MPYIYAYLEYANIVSVYDMCNGNAAAAVEYRKRFRHWENPDKNVFIRFF